MGQSGLQRGSRNVDDLCGENGGMEKVVMKAIQSEQNAYISIPLVVFLVRLVVLLVVLA